MNQLVKTATTAVATIDEQALAELADKADKLQDFAKADNTMRAYNSAWLDFARWCEGKGIVMDMNAQGAPSEAVRLYLLDRSGIDPEQPDQGQATGSLSVGTLRHRIAAIVAVHKHYDLPSPIDQGVTDTMQAIARIAQHRPKQAQALTEVDAQIILRSLGDTLADKRNAALLLFARSSLLRRSEIVRTNIEDLDIAGEIGTVSVGKTKTDQQGHGATRGLNPTTVDALKTWITASGITEGPLFQGINAAGKLTGRLSDKGVVRAFKKIAEQAGIDPANVSGHSCRVGTAQDLVLSGATLLEVMNAGGWKSASMPARYSEKATAALSPTTRMRA